MVRLGIHLPQVVYEYMLMTVIMNCMLIRMDGIMLKLAVFSAIASTSVALFMFLYAQAQLYALRAAVLRRRILTAKSRLMKLVFKACRVFRFRIGPFYEVDYIVIPFIITTIITYTVAVLLVLEFNIR